MTIAQHTRPLMRLPLDQIARMPEAGSNIMIHDVLAELEHRTTKAARKLRQELLAGMAAERPLAAKPGPVSQRKPVAKVQVLPKPAAPPARAANGKFPGVAPDRWEDLDADQLRWFRQKAPGSLELRLRKLDRGAEPVNSPAYVLSLLRKFKAKQPFVDVGNHKVDPNRDGLAFVLPGNWQWVDLKRHAKQDPAGYARVTARTQHVFDTMPALYDADERRDAKHRIGPPQAWQAEWRRAHFVRG